MRLPCSLAILALGSACSSDPAEASAPLPATTESEVDSGVAAPTNVIDFSSEPVTLQPGEEKYLCFAGNLPEDRDVLIKEISGTYGPGTHHVFFAWTLAPEPEGMTECDILFKTTWIPIYLGGTQTSPLTLPDGAAIDLERGRQLVLQLHLQNTTAEPIVNEVQMHIALHDSTEEFEPAGIFGLDNRAIALPPAAEDVPTRMSCTPGREMNVFSLLGHMHKLGESLTLEKNEEQVFHQPWYFEEQPILPAEFVVTPEDELTLTCRHSNPGDSVVTYGESSDTEMCAIILYYTPFDHLAGCIHTEALPEE
jgi:hypothetical protein